MGRIIVVLGGGVLQVPFIKAASRKYRIFLFDENPSAPGKEFAESFFSVPFHDWESIVRLLIPHKKSIFRIVTIATDFSLETTLISEKLSIPFYSPAIGEITTDKEKMREFFRDNGFAQPDFTASDNVQELTVFMDKDPSHTSGFVIKPVRNMGARGVQYVPDETHLLYALEYAQKFSRSKRVIMEQYIPTAELSVDALCFQGKIILTGIADRMIETYQERYFIERGHLMPSLEYEKIYDSMKSTFQKICDAFSRLQGYPYHAPLKGDIKYPMEKGKDFIIGEIASRLSGGFMSTHTFPYSYDKDLMELYLRFLENDVSLLAEEIRPRRYSAEINFEAVPGTLLSPLPETELAERYNSAHIRDNFPMFSPGDIIYPLRSNVGKSSHIILQSDDYPDLENLIKKIRKSYKADTGYTLLSDEQINRKAREIFNPQICVACDVCDGKNCVSHIPGMGGKGENHTFYANYRDLQSIRILEPEHPEENAEPDISFSFFGKKYAMPVFTAPITGSVTNLDFAITEWEMAEEITTGAFRAGTLAFLGDGATPNKFYIALKNQKKMGNTIPVFKPRKNQDEIKFRISEGISHGIFAWAMDIDSAGLVTMENKNQKTSRKTSEELRELSDFAGIPFIVKGVLTLEDAQKAMDANAAAIVVSNHGGRVDDELPSSISVLKEIASFVRKKNPHIKIAIDGGFRSGSDVFKALAMGADAVLIGRPSAIASVAYGRFGVYSILTRIATEIKEIMHRHSIHKLSEIGEKYVDYSQLPH